MRKGSNSMKHIVGSLLLCALILIAESPALCGSLKLYDISEREMVTLESVLPRLTAGRIVLIGEHHATAAHHEAQLEIIREIAETGLPLAIGLEMFRADSQDVLDRWIEGKTAVEDLRKAFSDNWGFSWTLYDDIFHYARDKKIPMVGLNISRAITRQVAREGFNSLSPEQKGTLPFVECIVDPEYMEFIKRAHGSHAHGKTNFNFFCEAQLVWDKAMAGRALEFLNTRPGFMMIILAGTGHVWKKAMPEQIRKQSTFGNTVILPQVPGEIDAERATLEDADFLFGNE